MTSETVQRKPKRAAKGFTCPNCREPMEIIRTNNRANSIVSRRRACTSCPYRVTTEERPKVAAPVSA